MNYGMILSYSRFCWFFFVFGVFYYLFLFKDSIEWGEMGKDIDRKFFLFKLKFCRLQFRFVLYFVEMKKQFVAVIICYVCFVRLYFGIFFVRLYYFCCIDFGFVFFVFREVVYGLISFKECFQYYFYQMKILKLLQKITCFVYLVERMVCFKLRIFRNKLKIILLYFIFSLQKIQNVVCRG